MAESTVNWAHYVVHIGWEIGLFSIFCYVYRSHEGGQLELLNCRQMDRPRDRTNHLAIWRVHAHWVYGYVYHQILNNTGVERGVLIRKLGAKCMKIWPCPFFTTRPTQNSWDTPILYTSLAKGGFQISHCNTTPYRGSTSSPIPIPCVRELYLSLLPLHNNIHCALMPHGKMVFGSAVQVNYVHTS